MDGDESEPGPTALRSASESRMIEARTSLAPTISAHGNILDAPRPTAARFTSLNS